MPLDKVAGSNTSCYTGNLSSDHRSVVSQDMDAMAKQSINCLPSLLSGRLSWFFDLRGPNLSLDTACSSGLVALDLGCKSLTNGSADMVSYLPASFEITKQSNRPS
jgi:acyl transferase domain-containing protein